MVKQSAFKAAALLLVCFQLCLEAQAHVTSVAGATATAGRAAVESLDTPFLNPAALPYEKGYFFGTGYSRQRSLGLGDLDVFSVSLSDNLSDTVIPTSLGYVQSKSVREDQPMDRKDVRLGFSNFFWRQNALGFGVAYRNSKGLIDSYSQTNVFLGSMFSVTKEVSLALVFENLLPPNSRDIPVSEKLSTTTSIAASYNYKTFLRGKIDLTSDSGNGWAHPTVALGLENYWNRWLIFRLGYAHNDELAQNIASTGLGFGGPKFSIHYAYQNIQSPTGSDPRHSIDLGVPVW